LHLLAARVSPARIGRIRLKTISDYHKHGYDREVMCRACGRRVSS
jgi:hypothetical protein